MTRNDDSHPLTGADHRIAADWVARRDRGLTAAEQDDYLQWLHEDPRRRTLIARHEATFDRMKGLARWQPASSREANPDLFAPQRRSRRWYVPALATAAAIATGFFVLRQAPATRVAPPSAPPNYLRVNDRQALADGSMVELRDGSHLEVQFTATERRVHLTGGEAHFTVAKNPDRPFIVAAGNVAVRAIGTAFNVRLDAASVDVLVTEGRVQVEQGAVTGPALPARAAAPTVVGASERTVVPLRAEPEDRSGPAVVAVTPAQVREVLAWQAPRLQFHETPVREAVAEFNRHNAHQLLIGDPTIGAIPIGGTFRVDNVDGFVRLLEVTLGIQGESQGPSATVLRRGR